MARARLAAMDRRIPAVARHPRGSLAAHILSTRFG